MKKIWGADMGRFERYPLGDFIAVSLLAGGKNLVSQLLSHGYPDRAALPRLRHDPGCPKVGNVSICGGMEL